MEWCCRCQRNVLVRVKKRKYDKYIRAEKVCSKCNMTLSVTKEKAVSVK